MQIDFSDITGTTVANSREMDLIIPFLYVKDDRYLDTPHHRLRWADKRVFTGFDLMVFPKGFLAFP